MVFRASEFLAGSLRINTLAKKLCLTERLVRNGMQELVEADLFVSRKAAGKVGHPVQEYEASQLLRDRIAQIGESESVHRDLIVRLFSEPEIYALGPFPADKGDADKGGERPARKLTRKDGRPAAPGAKGRLAASTRVLLTALLSVADHCGVATGVGEARLREMTGLNALSLKHQVKRLISLGFIRSLASGVSSGIFFKAKVPTIYYLNLDHPQLCPTRGERGLVVYVTHGAAFDRLATGVPSTQALMALGPAALNMMYHKLSGHTSRLLSAIWAEPDEAHSELKAAIAAEIADELEKLWIDAPKDEGFYWAETHENFHSAVCEWAGMLHQRLRRWKVWQSYKPQQIRLIPAPHRRDGLSITSLVVYPAPRSRVTCLVVWDTFQGSVDRYGSEADLDLAVRCEAGLLTET
ncbi:TPA: hypothetical protein L5D81_006062 [Pseudomonas aeruginosa]|nr:hypothetical protein [Pseudomonas aeruginosa]HBO8945721.1 hypothetical protein [Pseudomonas aeruginosa]HBO9286993.1 hypothetical protein [Pseudomonas aeruginosa]